MSIRGKILKTVGWGMVGVGLYLVAIGEKYDGGPAHTKPKRTGDIIDAEFTVLDD